MLVNPLLQDDEFFLTMVIIVPSFYGLMCIRTDMHDAYLREHSSSDHKNQGVSFLFGSDFN